jgi:hypothetical protein
LKSIGNECVTHENFLKIITKTLDI